MLRKMVVSFHISNLLIGLAEGELDERRLDYIMEIVMLAKVHQNVLIGEAMYTKLRGDVDKRNGLCMTFLSSMTKRKTAHARNEG